MSHIENNPAVKSQHEGWKAARARMGIAGRPKPISIPLGPYEPQEAISPARPLDAANRKRAEMRAKARAEKAERIRRQMEADQKALEQAKFAANQEIRSIVLETARYFGLPSAEIMSERRESKVSMARQVAMYLAKETTPHSYPNIGRRFRRDHSTVVHACRKIEAYLAKGNPVVTLAVAAIKDALNGGDPESYWGA